MTVPGGVPAAPPTKRDTWPRANVPARQFSNLSGRGALVADQKRWFKLWCSAPSDDHIQSLSPADAWAWAVLGCYTKLHGTRGRVVLSQTNAALEAEMRVRRGELFVTVSRLPHMTIEEGKPVNGKITVTWHNWTKYQEDSTVALRQKTSRSKRRGEEKRGEEIRTPLSTLPPAVAFQEEPTLPEWVTKLLADCPRFRAAPRLRSREWWLAMIRANPDVDLNAEALKANGWLMTNGNHRKDMPAFLRNWFTKAQADAAAET